LLVALSLHAALLLLRVRPRATPLRTAERSAEQTIDIDESALSEAPLGVSAPTEPTAVGSDIAQARSVASDSRRSVAVPRAMASSNVPTVSDGDSTSDVLAPAVEATPGQPATAEPERKIDLGLDGHFFLGQPREAADGVRKSEGKPKLDPQKRLQDALAADDVQRGLARGGALVGSLSAAAREAGPVRGEALFAVTVGADGGMLSTELVGGGSEWIAALGSFRALAAKKRLRVPPGARGLRVTFSVRAKVQRPSGKEVEDSAVRAARPSIVEPNGLVPHGDFDLADLGGGGQRLVYARVVSEEVL